MNSHKRVLGIIPARGGSKGVPRKNIKLLNGKPLISYTIEAANKSKLLDKTIVSTDDEEIAGVARKFGASVPFIRPSEFATDTASCVLLIHHALDWLKENESYVPDAIAFLPPTSPLRNEEHIDGTISLLWSSGMDSAVTIYQVNDHPWYIYELDKNRKLNEIITGVNKAVRRQDLPNYYGHSQAVIVSRIDYIKSCTTADLEFNLKSTAGFEISQEAALDIDTPFDFQLAEKLL